MPYLHWMGNHLLFCLVTEKAAAWNMVNGQVSRKMPPAAGPAKKHYHTCDISSFFSAHVVSMPVPA